MEFVIYALMVVGIFVGATKFLRYAHAKPKMAKDWETKFWSDFDAWREEPENRV